MCQKIIDEIESSLALLEPPALRVKLINLSFKNNWFSGIWAKYQPEGSLKSVFVFIPHNELKPPYHLRTAAEDFVKSHPFIEVYPLRIDINKQSRDPKKWQVPVGTMFSPTNTNRAAMEAEEVRSVDPNTEEINIKKGTIIERKDFKLEVIDVEYHNNEKDENRPKVIAFRITASLKYPIIRPEQKTNDLERWKNLSEHNDRLSSQKIRRFFYKKQGLNTIEIGDTVKITLFPIFNELERKKLQTEDYVGKIRIFYPNDN